MVESTLFVLSATIVISYFIKVISCICGNSMSVPIPILHVYDVGFSNTYVTTPAIMHQVYFWAMQIGVIGA